MQLFNIISERLPMVWFLLGLLFNALALYLSIESSMFFVYLVLGWGCCAYGVAIYFLQLCERPKQAEKTRVSPHFIASGQATAMPAVQPHQEPQRPEPEQSNAE
jgi:hypothetical protein